MTMTTPIQAPETQGASGGRESAPVALLRIAGLTVETGPRDRPVRLVDGFDLDIASGERVALVGESGSGKSVTARAVLRLDPELRVSGSVRLGGQELLTLPDKEMRSVRGARVGMVFQDPMSALNPLMTIGAQVAEPLRAAGVGRAQAHHRAVELLGELGVADAAARMRAYPHEFSGGMRQRVVLAKALIREPELLIADEPTTALDVRVQQQVLALLDRVARDRSLAVLLITHDLGIVAGFAQRVAVMYSGRKVHTGDVHAVFGAADHPYTAGLLAAVPRLDVPRRRLVAIPGGPPTPADRPAGCAFHPRCPEAVDICRTEIPQPRARPDGGVVACHRRQEQP
jgi:oligopeptide/dipeptide ABC transporter ATP-binding protein